MFEYEDTGPIAIAIGTLISEDLAYMGGLLSIQYNKLSYLEFIFAYVLGVTLGDLFLYLIGYFASKTNFSFINKVYAYLETKGDKGKSRLKSKSSRLDEFLIFTRFIPGVRIPTYTYCGFTGYPLTKFILILMFTSFIYAVTGLILLNSIITLSGGEFELHVKLALSIICALLTVVFFKGFMLLREDRLKYGSTLGPLVKRFTRLQYIEFHPPWIFYLPIVPAFIFWLIRYGGVNTILSCNPAIYLAGLIGEKKSEIDELIEQFVPQHRLSQISIPNATLSKIIDKMKDSHMDFPVYIKPDSGMRGTEVLRLNDESELQNYLSGSKKKLVIQEAFDSKYEFGVYYLKYQNEDRGRIFTITNKVLPFIIGDGKSNLTKLILQKKYVGDRFDMIYSEQPFQHNYVLTSGQKRLLTHKGSHSKGCMFLDGSEYLLNEYTEPLIDCFDKIIGFDVGRVDIKFKSLENLKNGDFKIIEINGVGGESSNYYDPRMSVFAAYKTMYLQWRNIFKIGNMNKEIGAKSKDGVVSLFKAIKDY